jgi:hypothetical protein
MKRLNCNTKRFKVVWILAVIFAAMYLTACREGTSTVSNYPNRNDKINLTLINMDLDFSQVVLNPEDVSDLFQGATYSINQTIVTPESQGVIVTYPTQFVPHTTAFAKGFSTRIEIFTNIDQAVKFYDTILTQQSGETLTMKLLGDDSRAFARTALTPEGFDLNNTEYAVLFRERNVVATIILRTDRQISSTRLGQLATLMIDRLRP